jgi:hypothetical protein
MLCVVATGRRNEVQRSEDELEGECFGVVFVQLILPPAGRRELDCRCPELLDHVAITSMVLCRPPDTFVAAKRSS